MRGIYNNSVQSKEQVNLKWIAPPAPKNLLKFLKISFSCSVRYKICLISLNRKGSYSDLKRGTRWKISEHLWLHKMTPHLQALRFNLDFYRAHPSIHHRTLGYLPISSNQRYQTKDITKAPIQLNILYDNRGMPQPYLISIETLRHASLGNHDISSQEAQEAEYLMKKSWYFY